MKIWDKIDNKEIENWSKICGQKGDFAFFLFFLPIHLQFLSLSMTDKIEVMKQKDKTNKPESECSPFAKFTALYSYFRPKFNPAQGFIWFIRNLLTWKIPKK